MSLLDKIVDFIQEIDNPKKRNRKDWFEFIKNSRLRHFIIPKKMMDHDGYIQASKTLAPHFEHIRNSFGLKEHFE